MQAVCPWKGLSLKATGVENASAYDGLPSYAGVRLPLLPQKNEKAFWLSRSFSMYMVSTNRLNVKSRLIYIICALEAQSKRSSLWAELRSLL